MLVPTSVSTLCRIQLKFCAELSIRSDWSTVENPDDVMSILLMQLNLVMKSMATPNNLPTHGDSSCPACSMIACTMHWLTACMALLQCCNLKTNKLETPNDAIPIICYPIALMRVWVWDYEYGMAKVMARSSKGPQPRLGDGGVERGGEFNTFYAYKEHFFINIRGSNRSS